MIYDMLELLFIFLYLAIVLALVMVGILLVGCAIALPAVGFLWVWRALS